MERRDLTRDQHYHRPAGFKNAPWSDCKPADSSQVRHYDEDFTPNHSHLIVVCLEVLCQRKHFCGPLLPHLLHPDFHVGQKHDAHASLIRHQTTLSLSQLRFNFCYLGTLTFVAIWAISSLMYFKGFSKQNIHNFFILAAIFQLLVMLEFIVAFLL